MNFSEIREKLKKESLLDVSRKTGISRMCLYNIVKSKNRGCNLSTLEKLIKYFADVSNEKK